jgi:hypothetical protein
MLAQSRNARPSPDDLSATGVLLLAAAVGVALANQGWSVEALPGEPATLRRDGRAFMPSEVVRQLARGELTAQEWLDQYHRLGVENTELIAA